jgi:hypothetical protein
MRAFNMSKLMFFCVSAIGLIVPYIQAADYSESTDGDLSNSRIQPTPFPLSVGTNMLTATSGIDGDLEYVRADVPVGTRLASLVLQSYTSTSAAAFIGMRSGTIIPENATVSNLSGYTLFGAQLGNIGHDILPQMGTAFGAMGFTPPLPTGSYFFWLEQPSAVATTYQFNFNVESLAPPGVVGDYNDDGTVDAADYVVWRDGLGTLYTQNDYEVWRAHFGASLGSGSGSALPSADPLSAAVPEPATIVLLVLATTGSWFERRHTGQRMSKTHSRMRGVI